MTQFIKNILQTIAVEREALMSHPIYTAIETIEDLRLFMTTHVYAVWDFMFLLKSLQQTLTCTDAVWIPIGNREIRRLINEIVLAEESDKMDGNVGSHFEFYLDAMEEIGCETTMIYRLVNEIESTKRFDPLLLATCKQTETNNFLRSTISLIEKGNIHEIAASFTFGREVVIPDMFVGIVSHINQQFPNRVNGFLAYLERHIELDGDEHGPLAYKMLELLCESNAQKWQEVEKVALSATTARIRLWDSIHQQIMRTKATLNPFG